MAYTSSLKQILSLNVKNQVQLMEWSNKMDLIAASNEKSDTKNFHFCYQIIKIFF